MIVSFLGGSIMKILRKFNTQENVKKLSIFILLLAFSLTYYNNNIKAQEYQLNYELINTKDMAMVTNPEKKETSKQTMRIFQIYNNKLCKCLSFCFRHYKL